MTPVTKKRIDDLYKSASLQAGAIPRRSTSSLGPGATVFLLKSRALIWAAVALLIIQGVFGLATCWLSGYWAPAPFSVLVIVAGIGVALGYWWSKFLVLALVLLLLLPYMLVQWHAVNSGLFRDRHGLEVFLMLVPGLVFFAGGIFCAYVAIRYVPSRTTSGPT